MGFDFQCSDAINPMTRVNFKSLVQDILDHAPSDASCEATLQRSGDDGPYRASIQIHSQEGEISCRKSCTSSNALLHSVKSDLFGQIRRWREGRDLDAPTAVM